MMIRYDEIGQRLRAFRIGSGLSAEEVGQRIGISRTAVYRFERGEVVKIETLIRLSELLGVSLPSLLGVEIEYISSSVTYFERLRQLEETADRIVVLAGPISYLLASDRFTGFLHELLSESVAGDSRHSDALLRDVDRIVSILAERRRCFFARRPSVINLISALDMERLLRSGLVGRTLVSAAEIGDRRRLARAEVEHFARLLEDSPIGVQIGLVTGTLPRTGMQIFRCGERKTLTLSPFRLGEQPNVRLGVAMITESDEALRLHESIVDELWRDALKGGEAAHYLRNLIAMVDGVHLTAE
jgi:transcriptional regulator with XRE-family HTH domain